MLASCSLSSDGLASPAVELDDDGSVPARAGSVPPSDAGSASLWGSAPPVVVPPEAGAPAAPVVVDAGVAVPADGPVAPPVVTPPASTPPAAPHVVRAKDVKVKRLIAGTVYLHKLEAKTGTAGKINIVSAPLIDLDLRGNLEVDELVVDTLYARDVQADHVQITETHASEVKIGKKGGDDGDDD